MAVKTQFLKGCARTLVLKVLSERPMYGYEIARELARRSENIFELGQGTLYPMLYSLENKGFIRMSGEEKDPETGRRRMYYALTEKGQEALAEDLDTWKAVERGMGLVLGEAYA